jgi:hypothetical protein
MPESGQTPMRIEAEIILARFHDASTLSYTVRNQSLTAQAGDPDDLVRTVAMSFLPGQTEESLRTCIIHSTSWRFEAPDRILLTYLVYSEELRLPTGLEARLDLRSAVLAENPDPARPRPDCIEETNVVFHAMRHLQFLLEQPHFAKRVSECGWHGLQSLQPLLAGQIG